MRKKPPILSHFDRIIDFVEVFESIGKLFLESSVKETNIVFPKGRLYRDIRSHVLDLALKAGVLVSINLLALLMKKLYKLCKLHKSIQDFITACGNEEAIASFRTHYITVDKVMELSHMIMFMCGLAPVVGCQLSELSVKNVINIDARHTQYRGKPNLC